MDEPLRQTLVDAVNLLRTEQISHVLIGGLAVSLRGQPRVTADVDMVILADVSRCLALVQGLDATSFQPLFADVAEVVQRAFILPLRHRVTNIKVDLALGLSGFEQQVLARAEQLPLAGMTISVATAEDLLMMKLLAGRPQDDQDVKGLVIAQGAQLDWSYCSQVAAELGEAVGQDLTTRIAEWRMKSDNQTK